MQRATNNLKEENIGQYYAEYWQKPRGYYWGKLLKVFSDDPDDAHSGEFKFLQRKERSTDPSRIFYDWPTQEDIEIIDAGRCFWGPTKPDSVNIGRGKTIYIIEYIME